MRKVYFIYVTMPKDVFEGVYKYLSVNRREPKETDDGYSVIYLYAWTTSKELKDIFKDQRSSEIFTYVKKELDSEMFQELKEEASILKLGKRRLVFDDFYSDARNDKDIPEDIYMDFAMSKDEFVNVTEYGVENFYTIQEGYEGVDFRIFKDEIVDKLDAIGYTMLEPMRFVGEDEDNEIAELIDNCRSYGQTLYGRDISTIPDIGVHDEVTRFLRIYGFTFTGRNINK